MAGLQIGRTLPTVLVRAGGCRGGRPQIVLRRTRIRRRGGPDGATDRRLRALVEDHAAAAYRTALAIVRDPAMAEDVVQETMIKAWLHLEHKAESGSERAWVLRIAHNTAVSTLRRVRDEATDPGTIPHIRDERDPARHVQGRAEIEQLRAALDQLDPLSRTVLVLRDVEQLSYQQIAEALDVPIPTVKTRLLRARREVQRLVRTEEPA